MKNWFSSVLEWIKKHILWLKLIFIGSVMVFVINQFVSILHGMTWERFKGLILQQGFSSVAMMIVVSFIAVTPMILYDVGTTKALNVSLSKRKLFNDGWIINTINNLAGFGGVVGATLRMNSYGKEKEEGSAGQVVATVTKTAFFMLTGLSILSLFAFIDLQFVQTNSPFTHYKIWLLGGSLFAPGLYIFIRLNQKKLFKEFTNRILVIFYTASFGQWLGAMMTFLFIGHQMLPDLSMTLVAPLFVVATLIGMITMVPGGMGTFDVLMILGLGALNVSKAVAVVWILFYRLFYFVLPFLSGIALFIHQTGQRVNEGLNHLPEMIISKCAHFFITFIMYGAGILTIILSAIPNLSVVSNIFSELLPFSFSFFDQTITMMIGLLLIGLARGVANRVKRAYAASIIVLGFGILSTTLLRPSWKLILFYAIVMGCIYLARHEFYREKFVYSWGGLLMDSLLMGGILIFYAIIGYFVNFNSTISTQNFILFPSEEVWLAGLAGLALSLCILLGLYQYLSADREVGDTFDASRLTALIENYGDSRYHHLAYTEKYRYYYYQADNGEEVALMFQVKANQCVVLDDPIGPRTLWQEAVEHFIDEIDCYNYQAVFFATSQDFSLLLHDLGYHFMKLSEEGYYCPTPGQIIPETHLHQLSVKEIEQYLPILKQISKTYERKHHSLNFIGVHFNESLLKASDVYVYEKEEQMLGYAVVSSTKDQASIIYVHMDLDCEKETQNFLQQLINHYQNLGYRLSLGANLQVLKVSARAFTEERLLNILYQYAANTSDIDEYEHLVLPYVNHWESRYLAYPHQRSFVFLLLQLASLIRYKKD